MFLNSWLELLAKTFKKVVNIIFLFSILVITGELFRLCLPSENIQLFVYFFKPVHLIFGVAMILISYFLFKTAPNKVVKFSRVVLLIISFLYVIISLFWIFDCYQNDVDLENIRVFLALSIGFLAVSFKISSLGNTDIHPAFLFILSFIFLILCGTFCLMLPAASHKGITILQALFTATSAVTVTGLAVLDTGKDFTIFGQTIILILIQLGGLGVLTITNIFALLFKSSTSFRNRMMVGEMIKEMRNKNTYNTLFKIIALTVLIESIGAIIIYVCIASNSNITQSPIFFSVFHAISAFCNGGFSTLSNSLYEESVRYNYGLQLVVSWLIISGGLSYSVMTNHYMFVKNWLLIRLSKIKHLGIVYQKELIRTTTNSRIILITTFILLVSGTLLFFIAEYDGVLRDHHLFGKIVVSFFNSTTPRTAGFNNINMAEIGIPAFMMTMALMWIGASPGSTGGGIKTTTFAVAILSLWNQILGKEKLVIKMREITASTINQVNAVILLSIFAISFGTFMLAFNHPDILFKDLLFECISAYSTVGLSMGITFGLNESSQIIIIVLMFLGRVSFLTFLISIFSQIFKEEKGCDPYYPKENVFIN